MKKRTENRFLDQSILAVFRSDQYMDSVLERSKEAGLHRIRDIIQMEAEPFFSKIGATKRARSKIELLLRNNDLEFRASHATKNSSGGERSLA